MKNEVQRLGLITVQMESGWRSCVSISANLIKAYETLQDDHGVKVHRFGVSPKTFAETFNVGTPYLINLAEDILAKKITDVVFIDHHIDPLPILNALKILDSRRFKSLRFTFHIYGDFTLTTYRWREIGKILSGLKVKYICASDRQCRLVSFFLPDDHSETALCPFPIDEKTYRFSSKVRAKVRKRLGVTEKQQVLLYTGRMSLQKGIVNLVDQFERLNPVANDYILVLAGPYDDLGGMTSGIRLPHGFYFDVLNSHIQKLPEAVRKRILFIGDLGVEDLKEIYSAADLFLSLSLHHDEDYGMCPAEALATGLPSILSDWAGYASFEKPGIPCQMVPVTMSKRGLSIDFENAFDKISRGARLSMRSTPERRLKDGAAFVKRYGVAGVAKILKELLRPESFGTGTEFNWALNLVVQSGHTLEGEFYREVYESYVKPASH